LNIYAPLVTPNIFPFPSLDQCQAYAETQHFPGCNIKGLFASNRASSRKDSLDAGKPPLLNVVTQIQKLKHKAVPTPWIDQGTPVSTPSTLSAKPLRQPIFKIGLHQHGDWIRSLKSKRRYLNPPISFQLELVVWCYLIYGCMRHILCDHIFDVINCKSA